MYYLVNVTFIECLLYARQTGTQLLGKLSWSVSWYHCVLTTLLTEFWVLSCDPKRSNAALPIFQC